MEVLDPYGRPEMSLAGNGRKLHILSHSEGRYRKIKSTDPSLKRLVSVPIRFAEIIALLSGRVPVAEHVTALAVKEMSRPVLILVDSNAGPVQKIYFRQGGMDVMGMERFKSNGSLIYKVALDDPRTINGHTIWFHMTVTTETDNTGFQLDIGRYWPGVEVSPSVFELTRPK